MLFSRFTIQPAGDVCAELSSSLETGLSSDEVARRLSQYGQNEFAHRKTTAAELFVRQCRSSFIYLLGAAALLSFFLGQAIDGLLIVLFIGINLILGFVQEYRSERALAFLSTFIVPQTRVRRDGSVSLIPTTVVVPGDVIVLEPGSMIPADLRFLDTRELTVDESALTGESVPTQKTSTPLAQEAAEIFHAHNIGFKGTTVVRGGGIGIVIATGVRTVFGGIAKTTVETTKHTAFQRELSSFSRFIVRLVLLTLGVLLIVNILLKGNGASITHLVIFSIALAVSVIPEALPLVITFSLSKGAKRLAQQKVVVKRLTAIEDLGSIDVLCTDKTGTLTENILTVAHVMAHRAGDPLMLACLATPHLAEHLERREAFDVALWNALAPEKRTQVMGYTMIAEIPFDPNRRRNTVIVKNSRHQSIIVRGASEEVFARCARIPKNDQKKYEQWIVEEGLQGRRVLALATRTLAGRENAFDVKKEEAHLRFAGLISFGDPLKRSTKDALIKSRTLGIQVKILTGDNPVVAGAVARSIGLVASERDVMTGSAFDALSLEGQRLAVERMQVFARVSPDQKFRIIQYLQQTHTVGFLGEGINDAPALKAAHVALVVQGGADIAREAADIVLLKKSLAVIIDGIHEGREVFANTLKYIRTTLASNFGNFYAVAISSLFIPFLPMLPLQILLLNLLSDFPMIAISTDLVDPEEVRSPRRYHVRDIALIATLLGLVSTVFDFLVFAVFRGFEPAILQTNWFIASVVTELVFLFSIRTRLFFLKAKRPSSGLMFFSAAAVALTVFLPYTALGQTVFSFHPPELAHLAIIAAIACAYLCVSETVKLMYYRHVNHV